MVRSTYLNTVAPPEDTDMKERHTGKEVTIIATNGKPDEVQYVRNFGAKPLSANPYMTREPQNKPLLGAEKAEVKIPALIIDGRTKRNNVNFIQIYLQND